jgi:hypothetical protein
MAKGTMPERPSQQLWFREKQYRKVLGERLRHVDAAPEISGRESLVGFCEEFSSSCGACGSRVVY